MMKSVSVIVALLAIVYGFHESGGLGALTGLVASILVVSCLATIVGERGTEGALAQTQKERVQRIGAVIGVIACGLGAYLGGWHWGWLAAIVGYGIGTASSIVSVCSKID